MPSRSKRPEHPLVKCPHCKQQFTFDKNGEPVAVIEYNMRDDIEIGDGLFGTRRIYTKEDWAKKRNRVLENPLPVAKGGPNE